MAGNVLNQTCPGYSNAAWQVSDIETLSTLLIFCKGNPLVLNGFHQTLVGSPHKRPVIRSFYVYYNISWNNLLNSTIAAGDDAQQVPILMAVPSIYSIVACFPISIHKASVTETVVINYWTTLVHGANMGPIWGRQDPGGPHVGPMNFAIWANNACKWGY